MWHDLLDSSLSCLVLLTGRRFAVGYLRFDARVQSLRTETVRLQMSVHETNGLAGTAYHPLSRICARTSIGEEFQFEVWIACWVLMFVFLACTVVVVLFPPDLDGKVVLEGPSGFRSKRYSYDPDPILSLAGKSIVVQQDAIQDQSACPAPTCTTS